MLQRAFRSNDTVARLAQRAGHPGPVPVAACRFHDPGAVPAAGWLAEGYGFDGIVVAFLAQLSPLMAPISAFFLSGLKVGGLMNVQYAIKDDVIYVLEVNPRASRTVPFVAKVIGEPIAKIASRVMAGESLASFGLKPKALNHVGVKEAVFPFARFPGVDTVLGPEMRSTGEVIGLDRSFGVAFAKSQLGGGTKVPTSGKVFVSMRDADKDRILPSIQMLTELGFTFVATSGTQRYLAEKGIACERINKVLEGRPHIVDAIKNGGIQLVFNTTEGAQALSDSRSLRRAALLHKVPYYTTLAGAMAAAEGIRAYSAGDLEVRALQEYFA